MPGDLENISKKMREMVDGLKAGFQKASANISGHIGDVLSDELKMTSETIKSVGASAKESSMKILKFFGTGWTLELKSFAVDKKQLDVLEDIKKQGEEEKLSRLARFKKSRGGRLLAQLLDLLGIPLAILAAGLGAIIGQILIPFKGIYKILKPFLKLFAGLTKIGKLFTKIAAIGKIAKLIKAFKWLGGLFSFFLKLPGIRIIAAGLKLGFTKLLWPLQILLSVFDFIKGFMETEGNILDKIKGGIKNAIMKFIKFPAQLIGKAVDWLFGREAGITETEMLNGISKYIDLFFKYFDMIFTPIKDAFFWLVDAIRKVTWKNVTDTIKNIRTWIEELPGKILKWFTDLLKESKDWWKKKLGIKFDDEHIVPKRGQEATVGDSLWNQKIDIQISEAKKNNKLQEEANIIRKKILEKEVAIPYPVDKPMAPPIVGPDEAPVPQFSAKELSELF